MDEPPTDDPLRVKAYGLVRMTRPCYLMLQGIGIPAVVLLLIVAWSRLTARLPFLENHLFTVLIVFLVLEGIETTLMLRKFNQATQNQQSQEQ